MFLKRCPPTREAVGAGASPDRRGGNAGHPRGARRGAAGGSTAGAADGARAAQSDARPNILLIETDDQTLENQRVLRNVNSLIGAQGVTFDSSFVSYPLCCPSRATTLTGQYAHNHQVLNNTRATGGGYYRLDGSNSLPVWLQRAGYATVHLGKYLNQYGSRNPTEIPPGWTEWHGLVDPTTYRFYNYTFNDDGIVHPHGNSGADYQTDVISSMAQEIIRRRAASPQPFFMWTAFLAPHAGQPREADDPQGLETPAPAPRHKNAFASEPLPRPPSFNEADVSDKPAGIRGRGRFDQGLINRITELYRQRMESLLAVDEGVAAIMQALQQTGELDSTLVIFTSDNGYFHGEHRVPAGKVLVYEPSIRVPLLMRGPGIPGGPIAARSWPTSTSPPPSWTRLGRAHQSAPWTAARCCRWPRMGVCSGGGTSCSRTAPRRTATRRYAPPATSTSSTSTASASSTTSRATRTSYRAR